jgi:heat shock protein HtpX
MLVLGGIFFFIGYVVLAVFWVPLLVAFFLLVLPRDREYLADAQAVLLTRYPESVVSLLEKAEESRSRGLKHGGFFINHMLFNQPQKKLVGFSSVPADLFDIHPPESARITRVEAMG